MSEETSTHGEREPGSNGAEAGRPPEGAITELARRRGFFFPANEAYGGAAGFYTYGPQGAALKRNLENAWRERFVRAEGHTEIDTPTVTPEPVFEASGHLDGFDDMIVECPDCGRSHRADHLIEDGTDIEDAESLGTDRVAELIAEHEVGCPVCGGDLAGEEVSGFNLMFETNIGPGSSTPGYLRPETAQGMFVEFPRLAEYARNQLPFGVGQVGRGYRNEISPRRSIIRVRELTMAELEHFVDPERDEPDLSEVADVELPLYPANAQQETASGDDNGLETMTVAQAVETGTIESDWIAYYLGIAKRWYESIGVDMSRFRYRQHLAGERAHYASDCWDAESEIDENWIEITGFADRGSYDLSKHAENGEESFSVFRPYDEPRTVERATVEPDMSYLGPEFGGAAADIGEALSELAKRDRSAFDGESVAVSIDGETYQVPTEHTGFSIEAVTENGEQIRPQVIEPAFGIDRLLYTVLDHGYREDEIDGEARTSLSLSPALAPTTVAVFPLMDKDGLGERAREITETLREEGFAVSYDDSGNIGRRYRRQDEIGTPYCVTVDYDSLEDDTVTLRERDSTAQRRVEIAALATEIDDALDR